MTSLMNISSTVSHGRNSVDLKMPNPLMLSICTPTDSTTSNVSCLIEATNDLHCTIRIHAETTRETKVPDTIHTRRIAQANVNHKLALMCFPLRNAKFMIFAFDRLAFSSSVSCIPLAFLKSTSVVSACVRKFDDINDNSLINFQLYTERPSVSVRNLELAFLRKNIKTTTREREREREKIVIDKHRR